jgi:ATP-dependent RNA helicase RhlE
VPLPESSPFRQFGFSQQVLDGVAAAGYAEPTPIQLQAIPAVIGGRDLIASAQTGTGKTAAFGLPILHRLSNRGSLRCLILEPTRELAVQVEESIRTLGAYTGLRTAVFYGGVGYGPQREALAHGIDILVATPGRLLDHMQNGAVSLENLEILVLDEVDRMLDMGFIPQVRRIVQRCPKERQTLLFSATVPDEIGRLAGWVLKDPQSIEIGARHSPADTIAHALYPVDIAQKFDLLLRLLDRTEYKSVLIFGRTKVGCDRIYEWLRAHGHNVGVIHADRTQIQRMEALRKFKAGEHEVLVATDIAARGLDIAGVTHVVNYDIPENPEDYVHRIGRTGRAQRDGDAVTLITWQDEAAVTAIERYIGRKIERKKADGFAYEKFPELVSKAAGPVKSFRFRGRM